MVFDAAIIGTGPAGISAALNLKLHNKETVWFGSTDFSVKVEKSEKIANYPGLGIISGEKLNRDFAAHTAQMGLVPIDKMVTQVMAGQGSYMLLADNDVYEAKTLLLAIGMVHTGGLEGEARLLGQGVSYCATCDGFLYKDKTIAVYCASTRYEHEVTYLAGMARHVYLYTPYPDCSISAPNVEKLPAPITEVQGEMRVTNIMLADKTQREVQGVFILRSAVAPASLLSGLAMDGAHITVNRAQATNLAGCFAAGDCTGRPYQIAKAVGEGNVAAHSMLEYLAELEKQEKQT